MDHERVDVQGLPVIDGHVLRHPRAGIRRQDAGQDGGGGGIIGVVARVHEAQVRDVSDEGSFVPVDDPRRQHAVGDRDGHAARQDVRDAADDDDAFFRTHRDTLGIHGAAHIEGAVVAQKPADVDALHQAAEQQGGDPAVRIAAHVQDIAPATRDHPDPFGDVGATVTEELEGRRIQGQRCGIVPASLPAQAFRLGHRQDTRRIVETEGRARAHHEITRRHDIGRAAGVDQGTAQAAEEEVAEVLDRTGREGAADIESGTQVHDRRTGVILILHQHRGAAAVAAADIVELVDRREDRADEQVGRITGVAVGQDVGRAGAADVEDAAAGTEAVGIAGADAEGRAVISAHLTHEVVSATEERRAVADLAEVEVLRVDGVQLHLDRAGVAAEARGVGRRGEHEGAEVLGAAEAADTEVDGREREVSRDADEREAGVARTEVELAGPAGGHVGRGVELDRRSRLDEDVAAGDLGRVAERDELAGARTEEGVASVSDVTTEEGGTISREEEAAVLLVERAVARDLSGDRRLGTDREVGVPRHGQVAEVGIRARPAVGDVTGLDDQVRRTERAAEGEIAEDDGFV